MPTAFDAMGEQRAEKALPHPREQVSFPDGNAPVAPLDHTAVAISVMF
jgi:hypothetical protein